MPYIKQNVRDYLDSGGFPDGPGQVNYLLSCVCNDYLNHVGFNYGSINDLVGALDCCKMELYRRLAGPYEDTKIKENGDVYGEVFERDRSSEKELRRQGVEL